MEQAHLWYYFAYLVWVEEQLVIVDEGYDVKSDLKEVRKEIKYISDKINKMVGEV